MKLFILGLLRLINGLALIFALIAAFVSIIFSFGYLSDREFHKFFMGGLATLLSILAVKFFYDRDSRIIVSQDSEINESILLKLNNPKKNNHIYILSSGIRPYLLNTLSITICLCMLSAVLLIGFKVYKTSGADIRLILFISLTGLFQAFWLASTLQDVYLLSRKPVLKIDEIGIHHYRWGEIFWKDIDYLSLRNKGRSLIDYWFLELTIQNKPFYSDQLSTISRWWLSAYTFSSKNRIDLSLMSSEINARFATKMAKTFFNQYGDHTPERRTKRLNSFESSIEAFRNLMPFKTKKYSKKTELILNELNEIKQSIKNNSK